LFLGNNSNLECPSLLCKWQFDLPSPPLPITIKLVLNCNIKKNSDYFMKLPQSGRFQFQCDRPSAYCSAESWGSASSFQGFHKHIFFIMKSVNTRVMIVSLFGAFV